MASSSSPSLPPSTYGHHVYISFRRDQESRNVTDMVDKGLNIRGVQTYRDKDHPAISQTGTDIPKELREGMQDSTISVVMLSKGFLASSWCLEELVRILDCRERMGMVVLPIFYGVDPSDIRKARGYAAQELRNQKVGGLWWRRWKNALEVVGGLCGWDYSNENRAKWERQPLPERFMSKSVSLLMEAASSLPLVKNQNNQMV